MPTCRRNAPAFIIQAFCLLGVVVITGCGYRLQGSGSVLPPDIQKIAVAQVENNTTEPGLSLELQEALSSEFERYGVVSVVDNPSKADAVLSAKIQNIATAVRGVTGETDIEVELTLTMQVAAELRRTNGQILWTNPRLRANTSFASAGSNVVTTSSGFAQGDIGADTLAGLDDREVSRGQKRQALSELIEEVSRVTYLDAVAADF